jgi:mercuric reductase
MDYDLAIVGSGSAGFAAAIAARRRGLRVVMVEQGTLGGTCVNVGCIPSKALLAAAEARRVAAETRFPGIRTEAGPTDAAALVAGKDELVGELRREKYEDLVEAYGFELRRGRARFVAGPALEVEGERVEAAHYLVATGAAPFVPPVPGLVEVEYLTSTSALALSALPESLVVVGGNAVGLELGQAFSRLGVEVTLLEALDRLAPAEEPELSAVLAEALASEGIRVETGAEVAEVGRAGDGVRVRTRDGREVRADALLMATGRRPRSAELGLPEVGVALGPRGEVPVDGRLRSAHPRIWAAGDVTGGPQYVYLAAAQGAAVVENAFDGGEHPLDLATLPRVTFTSPALASVGLTDAQAAAAGIPCRCRVLPLDAVPRAIVARDTWGVVKVVAEAGSGRVLGVHVAAAQAGEVILAATYALRAGMTVDDLAGTWAPYLTMGEALKLAAQSFRTDVRQLSCCAA